MSETRHREQRFPCNTYLFRINELYNLYPTHETQGSSLGVYFFAGHSCFVRSALTVWWGCGRLFTSRAVRTWRILAQVIVCDFCCFSQHALLDVHILCSHRCVVRWGGHKRWPCVYCFCPARRVSFSKRALMHTGYSQSAKDMGRYFKSQLYA